MHWLDDRERLDASARTSARVARDWSAGAAQARLRAHFDAVAPDDAGAVCAAAEALFAEGDWVEALLAPLIAALAADLLFEPPLRVHRDPLRTGAILFDHPAVSINAGVLSAAALAGLHPPASVVATGRWSVVRYHRAGGARLRQWSVRGERAEEIGALTLADGAVMRIDGSRQATLLAAAPRDVVTLTATVRAGAAGAMREFAIGGGGLLRTATTDDGASRTAMLLTLLRVSGRADAGEVFEMATREPARHLRWEAMREWLALDVAGALPRLRGMAMGDPDDEVRAAAAAMLPVAQGHAACRG